MASGLGNDGIVPGLALDQYRQQIQLDEPWHNEGGSLLSAGKGPRSLRACLIG